MTVKIVQKEVAKIRSVGVIGTRTLGFQHADKVGLVTEDLLGRGYHIASGGAIGTDQFVIDRLLDLGRSHEGTVYAAWKHYPGFPVKVRSLVRTFKERGGSIIWGQAEGKEPAFVLKTAYLSRNERLVEAGYGLVAFINGDSRGSVFTIKKAAKKHLPLVVFPIACHLPEITSVKWVPLRCGGCWEGGFKAVYLR